jgi:hypothetical protein
MHVAWVNHRILCYLRDAHYSARSTDAAFHAYDSVATLIATSGDHLPVAFQGGRGVIPQSVTLDKATRLEVSWGEDSFCVSMDDCREIWASFKLVMVLLFFCIANKPATPR